MSEEKKPINNDVLDSVSGGYADSGTTMMIVGNGGCRALRSQPCWDPNNVLTMMESGHPAYATSATMSGSGQNGTTCIYRYVTYNCIFGWADTACLN